MCSQIVPSSHDIGCLICVVSAQACSPPSDPQVNRTLGSETHKGCLVLPNPPKISSGIKQTDFGLGYSNAIAYSSGTALLRLLR